MDRKFDVPKSGEWFADNVFSISLKEGDTDSASPGLIVFERTPHEGAQDDIERYVLGNILDGIRAANCLWPLKENADLGGL